MSTVQGPGPAPGFVSIQSIRQLRQAADVLTSHADWQRSHQIEQLGLKRYVFSALGDAAGRPAAGCQLLWSDRIESVPDARISLGEYLFQKAQKERDLPQAILTADGEKRYL